MLDINKDFNDRNLAESEETIEKVIKYLKYNDPSNANREYAIGFLRFMQNSAKQVADKSALSFEDFVSRYNESQRNS